MLKRAKRNELNIGDKVKVLFPTEDGKKRYISGWVLWVPEGNWKITVAIGTNSEKIRAIYVGTSMIYFEK